MRYLPYWCFYLHQGMITALILQGVSGYFRHQGWDLARLSLLSLTMLPWVAKCLWAPWCERHARSRRGIPYFGSLSALQLLMALLLADIAFLPPAHMAAMLIPALMLLTFLSASHDIYADGITIRTTTAASRPWANTAQVGGSYLGMLFGSFLFLTLAENAGWKSGFLSLAALSLGLLSLAGRALRTARPQRERRIRARPSLAWRNVVALWPVLAFTALYYPAMRGIMALQTVMLVDRHLSMTALGQVLTLYGTVAGGLGILAGNLLARRLGALRCLLPVMAAQAALATVLALGAAHYALSTLLFLLGLINLAAAVGFITLYNALMGLVRAHQPASDYALFQSTDMAVAMLISLLALRFAHYAGYGMVLGAFALFSLAALWPARRLLRRCTPSAGEAPVHRAKTTPAP